MTDVRAHVHMIRYGPDCGRWSYFVGRQVNDFGWQRILTTGQTEHGEEALAAALAALRRLTR